MPTTSNCRQSFERVGGSALVNASEVARTSQHLPTNLHRSRARPGAEASKVFPDELQAWLDEADPDET